MIACTLKPINILLQCSVVKVMHYYYVIMSAVASQITSPTSVYSTVYSGVDQRKHQSSVSLAFVRGIHRWPLNSPQKGQVTRKMYPFDDVIMVPRYSEHWQSVHVWYIFNLNLLTSVWHYWISVSNAWFSELCLDHSLYIWSWNRCINLLGHDPFCWNWTIWEPMVYSFGDLCAVLKSNLSRKAPKQHIDVKWTHYHWRTCKLE